MNRASRAVRATLCFVLSLPVVAGAQTCDPEVYDNMPDERFIVLEDNWTVRDRVTGLEWQRCALGQAWSGETCKDDRKKQVRSWFSWSEAQEEVRKLQSDPRYRGWRLPTVQELRSLVSRKCKDPALNTRVFPNAPAWHYWSSSELRQNPDYAWQVDFRDGSTNAHLKTNISYNIRLVRGEQIPTSRQRSEKKTDEQAERLKAWDDGIHDTSDPDILLLQHPDEVLKGMPRDTRGRVDWAKVLLDGIIAPRASRDGSGEMVVWDQDLLFKDTASMPWVKFPHKLHSMWLACENCHDAIFPPQRGQIDISMQDIYEGRYCGVCHGKVAFTPNSCERCHSVLHPGSPRKWW